MKYLQTQTTDIVEGIKQAFGELPETKRGFVKKVYGITTSQLLATTIMALIMYQSSTLQNIADHIKIPMMIATIAIAILIYCNTKLAHKVPANYILMGVFTFCESTIVGLYCSQYQPQVVVASLILASSIFVGLSCHAILSRSKYLISVPMVIVMLSFASLGLFIASFFYWNSMLTNVMLVIGVVFAAFYIVVDTQIICHKLSEDDYIAGSMMLYVDFLNLFIKILQIVSKFSDDEGKKKK